MLCENVSDITSLQNPRIKQLVKLRSKDERDQSGLFLIEGYREILRALDAGRAIDSLFFCQELFLGDNEFSLIARAAKQGAKLYRCSEAVFRKISYRDRPDGILALAPQLQSTLQDLSRCLEKTALPFLVVAEAIEKPGNLGTILRVSDAVGLDGLIVCDRCTDIHNPNVVRASVGTLFTVPVVEAEGKETLEWLRRHKIPIVAATPSASLAFTEADFCGPIAIAVGTEQLGLSKQWMEEATIHVRIPMQGVADSLNVAMATTLLLYEVRRQRQAKAP